MRYKYIKFYLDNVFKPLPFEEEKYWLKEFDIDFKEDLEISKSQFLYIKKYFDEYENDEINLNDFKGVVKLFVKFFHECEARFGENEFKSLEDISLKAQKFLNDLFTLLEKQKDFIKHRFGLDSSQDDENEYYLENSNYKLFSYNKKTNHFNVYQNGKWTNSVITYKLFLNE